jgi:hypothetical protein
MTLRWPALVALSAAAALAQKYSGPRPPKPDVIYLLHASNLVETDSAEAQEQQGKRDYTTYIVPGPAAKARTPVAEPIFLIAADKLKPESLEMYRFEVKNGRRELSLPQKPTRNSPRPVRVSITRLEAGLYRLEAAQFLENGEYGFSPSGSNRVFCFQVY